MINIANLSILIVNTKDVCSPGFMDKFDIVIVSSGLVWKDRTGKITSAHVFLDFVIGNIFVADSILSFKDDEYEVIVFSDDTNYWKKKLDIPVKLLD